MAPALAEKMVGRLLQLDEWIVRPSVDGPDGPRDPRELEWTKNIAASVPTVQRELDALVASGRTLPSADEVAGTSQGAEGEWTTLVLDWFGTKVTANSERFPETMALLESVPRLQGAGFTVLGPRSHVPVHQGPAHSFRYLLGVVVPGPDDSCRFKVGDTTRSWTVGGEALFDDRTPHEAWNDSDGRRYLMFVQTRIPVSGPRGVAHRVTQWLFGRLTSGIARRADRFDATLTQAAPPA